MNQEMSREVGRLNSLISQFFIEKKNFFSSFCSCDFFKEKPRKMTFACCTNYLNKENSDNVKVFSGLVIYYILYSGKTYFYRKNSSLENLTI